MARFIFSLLVLSSAIASSLAQTIGAPTPQQCDQAMLLSQGIQLNINDQKNEQAALQQVDAALKSNNPQQFQIAKANLLNFVNAGIAIRQMNQQITPAGNKATGGIAKVANAQLEELGLVQSLTGNPQQDAPTVQTLAKDFAGGVMQNMQNMADAMAGCGPAGPGGGANAAASNATRRVRRNGLVN